jgi:hypothetical protein
MPPPDRSPAGEALRARPSQGCQQNERATDTMMEGGHASHSWRLIARLPNASDRLDHGLKQPASALAR